MDASPLLDLDAVCARIDRKRSDLRTLFGVSAAAISQWAENGLPPARALEMERRFEGKVRASEIKTVEQGKRGPRPKKAKTKRRAA